MQCSIHTASRKRHWDVMSEGGGVSFMIIQTHKLREIYGFVVLVFEVHSTLRLAFNGNAPFCTDRSYDILVAHCMSTQWGG